MPAAFNNMDHQRITGPPGHGDQPSVLVVEDEPMIRLVAVAHLEDDGFAVLEACDVSEALEVLRTGRVHVDLIFSDIQMPGPLDGCDLARWVQENRPGLPIILASGRIGDDALGDELCRLAPILAKPYSLGELTHRICAELGR